MQNAEAFFIKRELWINVFEHVYEPGAQKRNFTFFFSHFAQTRPWKITFVRQVLSFSYQIQNLCCSWFASVSSTPPKKTGKCRAGFLLKSLPSRGSWWMFKEIFLQVKITSSSATGAFWENSMKHKSLAWLICTLGIHLREISLKFRI